MYEEMVRQERIKKAVFSRKIFRVSGSILLISLIVFVILNGSVGLPDDKVLYLAIPFDKVLYIALPLALGVFAGLFFGIIMKPKRALQEREQRFVWEDVGIGLVLGIIIGWALKDLFYFSIFTFSFIAICRLIIAISYFRKSGDNY